MKPIVNINELIELLRKKSVSSLGCVISLQVDDHEIVLDGVSGEVHQQKVAADCTVKTTINDISDIISGKLDPSAAFMMGKIQVEGDLTKAMRLQTLLT